VAWQPNVRVSLASLSFRKEAPDENRLASGDIPLSNNGGCQGLFSKALRARRNPNRGGIVTGWKVLPPRAHRKIEPPMGRNLYILAASLIVFAVVSCGIAYTNIARQPGSPGDVSLWRTMGLGLLVIGLLVALAGILSSLFEQAERRAEEARRARRKR
jgi:F0F1-type ATP synthase membrane subunit c/vacuolar-type H+-ATPase subunit K